MATTWTEWRQGDLKARLLHTGVVYIIDNFNFPKFIFDKCANHVFMATFCKEADGKRIVGDGRLCTSGGGTSRASCSTNDRTTEQSHPEGNRNKHHLSLFLGFTINLHAVASREDLVSAITDFATIDLDDLRSAVRGIWPVACAQERYLVGSPPWPAVRDCCTGEAPEGQADSPKRQTSGSRNPAHLYSNLEAMLTDRKC